MLSIAYSNALNMKNNYRNLIINHSYTQEN